jgi:hypothetical protein
MSILDLDLVVRVATGVVSLAGLVIAVRQWRRLDRLDREHRARMSQPLLDRE